MTFWRTMCTCKFPCEHCNLVHKAWHYTIFKNLDHVYNTLLCQVIMNFPICYYCKSISFVTYHWIIKNDPSYAYIYIHLCVCVYIYNYYTLNRCVYIQCFIPWCYIVLSYYIFFLSHWLSNYFFRELKHFSHAVEKISSWTAA